MRRGEVVAVALLAACSGEAEQVPAVDHAARILCALGDGEFTRACTVERVEGEVGIELTVHHPDGAFRRFDVLASGLATADGAQPALISQRQGEVEVAVGADRYRIPATVVGDDGE